jgi:2-desacetyl-2-hydroxyethyl bacteriochlorophyllide A dehydrogenase
MRAVRVVEPSVLEVTDVPEAPLVSGARVRIEQVGVCGTDVKIFHGAIPAAYPRILGHEAVGRVVEAGPLALVKQGQRVLIDPGIACGVCDLCRRDRANLCLNGGLLGRELDGVFAESIVVPEHQLIPVPDSITPDEAGLLQVLGTVVHAQQAVDVFPGQVAVVVGLGVSGLLMVQVLRARGANVVGISRSQAKRDLAARFGASATATPDEAVAAVAAFTDGHGADLVVEAVGTEDTLAQAIELAGMGRTVLMFGIVTGSGKGLPYYELYYKELTLVGSRNAVHRDFVAGMRLASDGVVDLAPLVTHRFPLEEAAKAFAAVEESSSLKVVMAVG